MKQILTESLMMVRKLKQSTVSSGDLKFERNSQRSAFGWVVGHIVCEEASHEVRYEKVLLGTMFITYLVGR